MKEFRQAYKDEYNARLSDVRAAAKADFERMLARNAEEERLEAEAKASGGSLPFGALLRPFVSRVPAERARLRRVDPRRV